MCAPYANSQLGNAGASTDKADASTFALHAAALNNGYAPAPLAWSSLDLAFGLVTIKSPTEALVTVYSSTTGEVLDKSILKQRQWTREAVAISAAVTASSMYSGLSDTPALAKYTAGSQVALSYSDGSTATHTLNYEAWFTTGTLVPSSSVAVVAGGYVDINGNPIIDASFPGGRQYFSDSPDGMVLIPGPTDAPGLLPNASAGIAGVAGAIPGVTGNPVFAVTHFEYATWNAAHTVSMYQKLPSPLAVVTLDQDRVSGALKFVKYEPVNTAPVNGLWVTCGGSLSPWGTFLSSEEYEPDSNQNFTGSVFNAFSTNLLGNTSAKYYHYGWIPEVTVDPATGKGAIVKHYSMGRFSHEIAEVQADEKTVYFGDDATNAIFFMYVADTPRDLSAGTLYAAQLTSAFNITAGSTPASLQWIKLGAATDAEIKALANTLVLADIMDVKTVNPSDASYTLIFAAGKKEWVKLVAGMEKAAAFLETRRYAALVGATAAFTKLEGVTSNAKDKYVYAALQNVQGSMISGNSVNNATGPVKLAATLSAGAVVALKLGGAVVDASGAPINSEYVATNLGTLVTGKDISANTLGDTADPTIFANPDNVKYSPLFRSIFVGEDCSQHVTCMVWAYNIDTKVQSRIASVPAGGEATGLGVYDDLNGFIYITGSFQHPGDWGTNTIYNKIKAVVEPRLKANYNNLDAVSERPSWTTPRPPSPHHLQLIPLPPPSPLPPPRPRWAISRARPPRAPPPCR